MKTFVIGDIHGNFKALKEVLQKSEFNYKKDELIILGDVVDGHMQTRQCVEELLKIKHKIFILGNHDKWFIEHMRRGSTPTIWTSQGGINTLTSYSAEVKSEGNTTTPAILDMENFKVPVTHQHFFNTNIPYYIDHRNFAYVHAGFKPDSPIHEQMIRNRKEAAYNLIWDRTLIAFAKQRPVPFYKHVFVGHSTTQLIGGSDPNIDNCLEPITFHNLTCMDTGAGWNGTLSIMNVESGEFWVSKIQKPPEVTK